MLHCIKWFLIECRKRNYSGQSQQTQTGQQTNVNLKQIRVTGAKRGKIRVSKSRLVLHVFLRKLCEFANQSHNQSKHELNSTLG